MYREPYEPSEPMLDLTDFGLIQPEPQPSLVGETLHIIGCLGAAILAVMARCGLCLFGIGG